MNDWCQEFLRHPTETSPSVSYNDSTRTLVLGGQSYPSNALEFFGPIFQSVREFFAAGQNELNLEIKLIYFNSASNKFLHELLGLLVEFKNQGRQIKVTWHHDPQDLEMREEIVDFSEDFPSLEIRIDASPMRG